MSCYGHKKVSSEDASGYFPITTYDGLKVRKTPCNTKSWLAGGGIAAFVILAIGAVTAAYFLIPTFHTMLNNTFSHIQNGQMSVAEGLLYIGLPVGGTAFILGATIHLYRKHQQRMKRLNHWEKTGSQAKDFMHTLKTMKPTRKQAIIGTVAFILIAALAVGGYFFFQHVGVANQWMNNQVIPAFQHKIQIWQGLAYIGGGTLTAALATGLAIRLLQVRSERLADKTKNVASLFDENTDT